MASVDWNKENTSVVTELFAEQVRRGNQPNTHLNNVAYDEVARRFKDKTGLDLKKTQLKNKWVKLKNEYGIWRKLLLKQTGAGWDNERGTIKQDSESWKKDTPSCGRFQKHGISNEENLKHMFGDITSNGNDHWSPANGNLPQPAGEAIETVNVDADDNDIDESPISANGKRAAKVMNDKNKRPKSSQVMQEEIGKMGVLAERTESCLVFHKKR